MDALTDEEADRIRGEAADDVGRKLAAQAEHYDANIRRAELRGIRCVSDRVFIDTSHIYAEAYRAAIALLQRSPR